MKTIIETQRLLLRELEADDAEDFFRLNENLKVIQYTGDSAFKNREDAKKFLKNYREYELHGYGRWAVINKDSKRFLGWCGLKYNREEDETDLGFRFFEEEWNKGYATESARACVEYGFKELQLKKIIGRAMRDNVASIKVLEKIGFQFETTTFLNGQPALLYTKEYEK